MSRLKSLTQHPLSRLALSATGPLLLKVVTALAGLLFNYLATQLLTADEFGAFSLAQVCLIVIVTLTKLGLENTLVKLVAGARAKGNVAYTHSIYSVSLTIAVFSAGIAGITIWGLNQSIAVGLLQQAALLPLLPVVAIIILPNTLIAINASMFKAVKMPSLSILFTGLMTLIIASLLAVTLKPDSAEKLLWLFCLAAYVACLFSFAGCLLLTRVKWSFNTTPVAQIRASCVPLWTASIVAIVIQQFSTLVVSRYVSIEEVGFYALAIKIATLMSFVLIAINAVVSPRFAGLHSTGDKPALRVLSRHISQLLIVTAACMFAVVFLLADWIMALFGEQYTAGAEYLRILAFGQMINVGTGSVVNLLIMTGHEKLHQRNTLFIAALTALLAFTLIPRFGATGAATTTAIAMATQNLLSYYFVQKRVFNF